MVYTNDELPCEGAGISLAIEGYVTGEHRHVIEVRIGTLTTSCVCPVSASLAEVMVDEFYYNGLLPQEKPLKSIIANFIQNCAAVYEKSGIDHFLFDPVYVNAHGYNVTNARIVHTQEQAAA